MFFFFFICLLLHIIYNFIVYMYMVRGTVYIHDVLGHIILLEIIAPGSRGGAREMGIFHRSQRRRRERTFELGPAGKRRRWVHIERKHPLLTFSTNEILARGLLYFHHRRYTIITATQYIYSFFFLPKASTSFLSSIRSVGCFCYLFH